MIYNKYELKLFLKKEHSEEYKYLIKIVDFVISNQYLNDLLNENIITLCGYDKIDNKFKLLSININIHNYCTFIRTMKLNKIYDIQ